MKHQVDHRDVDHAFTAHRQRFVVFAQSAVFAEPTERALHDPAFGQHHELAHIGSPNDFNHTAIPPPGHTHKLAGIAAVRPDQLEPPEPPDDLRQHILAAVAVLDIRCMYDHGENQTERVNNNMPFSAGDLLARVVSVRPPFCGAAVLTDCESSIAAEGVGFFPTWRRAFSRSLS